MLETLSQIRSDTSLVMGMRMIRGELAAIAQSLDSKARLVKDTELAKWLRDVAQTLDQCQECDE